MRRLAIAGVGLLASFASCASPTTITLEVRADSEVCDRRLRIGVVAASDIERSADHPLQVFDEGCDSGNVGTLVISPRDDSEAARNERIGIRVVAGLDGKSANACDDPDGVVGAGCIIARREVTFVEGSNVPITVTLEGACAHVTCPNGYECNPEATDPESACVSRTAIAPGDAGTD